ncbi:hypothetical protein [Mammaliicoccus sp. Dog046]|uniref:hypothetical protein n=1 Tax=Mammaliicoccus sp. Dog046 TaxID=3034233 RepID=UPI002B263588|nr:hypothetical protein [Mammaliicoccus sp. Dog046]WQK84964.1 hypothetical protein P3U32_10060 [Mammaliicoccus sp. Dog046]
MKKLFVLLFVSLLVLGACGQKEETPSKNDTKDTMKEIKKEKSDKKKDTGKKESTKKAEVKSKEQATEEVQNTQEVQSTQEVNTNEVVTNEQAVQETQSIEQPAQDQQPVEQSVQEPVQQKPSKDEVAEQFRNGQDVNGQVDNEGNEYVQAQGGGDAMGYYKPDGSFCTVGGCVSPEAQEKMDKEMEAE